MDTDPPQLRRLLAALTSLGGDPAVAEKHAQIIHMRMINFVTQRHSRGHDLGRDAEGFYARPRKETAGPARELRDIVGKARKAVAGRLDKEEWIDAWTALPERTKRLWRMPLIRTPEGRTVDRDKLAGGFSAPGFYTIVPKAEEVLPLIAAELARIKKTPGEKRRQRDENEHVAIEAIRAAYRALTGHKGGRVIAGGKLKGRLVRLGREIDEIFDTALFAAKDSRRLR